MNQKFVEFVENRKFENKYIQLITQPNPQIQTIPWFSQLLDGGKGVDELIFMLRQIVLHLLSLYGEILAIYELIYGIPVPLIQV